MAKRGPKVRTTCRICGKPRVHKMRALCAAHVKAWQHKLYRVYRRSYSLKDPSAIARANSEQGLSALGQESNYRRKT